MCEDSETWDSLKDGNYLRHLFVLKIFNDAKVLG